MDVGLDSLGAVELRDAAAAAFDIQLPATAALDHPTLESLAALVAARLAAAAAAAENAVPGGSAAGASDEEYEGSWRGSEHGSDKASAASGDAGVDVTDIVAAVAAAAAEVVGAPVTLEQPFMEVVIQKPYSLACHNCRRLCLLCSTYTSSDQAGWCARLRHAIIQHEHEYEHEHEDESIQGDGGAAQSLRVTYPRVTHETAQSLSRDFRTRFHLLGVAYIRDHLGWSRPTGWHKIAGSRRPVRSACCASLLQRPHARKFHVCEPAGAGLDSMEKFEPWLGVASYSAFLQPETVLPV